MKWEMTPKVTFLSGLGVEMVGLALPYVLPKSPEWAWWAFFAIGGVIIFWAFAKEVLTRKKTQPLFDLTFEQLFNRVLRHPSEKRLAVLFRLTSSLRTHAFNGEIEIAAKAGPVPLSSLQHKIIPKEYWEHWQIDIPAFLEDGTVRTQRATTVSINDSTRFSDLRFSSQQVRKHITFKTGISWWRWRLKQRPLFPTRI